MENMIDTAVAGVPAIRQTHRTRQAAPPDPDLSVPERGATGPVPIGQVMEPLNRIFKHPDRNRLLAEFFNRHW